MIITTKGKGLKEWSQTKGMMWIEPLTESADKIEDLTIKLDVKNNQGKMEQFVVYFDKSETERLKKYLD